jgi:UDP-N-acetylglucosamine diphosphorylase / glucose-1-phosphate thymidylyltransferase / UDP-N-acetylgalactosamine diphosphorylase / glucosamine-1-phosphate N-acetyltransferase / galactosamine-1-phosphate N-acetyltransferase
MAGLGSRFRDSGFSLPKPLIEVNRKPMYRHAIDCLPLELACNLIFIVRENEFSSTLIKDIKSHYASHNNCHIIQLLQDTQGQAETVLKCAPHLNLNVPSLVHNCDTYIETDFDWKKLTERNIDGAIILFPSQEERWSYAKLDEQESKVIDVQEKKVISNHATTGTYYFKDTPLLLENIKLIIRNNWRENNEFYFSTVYKTMIHSNKYIIPLWTKKMLCFGTPNDLVSSLNKMLLTKALVGVDND